MPYSSIARISGFMSYGLERITFHTEKDVLAPITILFFCDHYWPEMSASKLSASSSPKESILVSNSLYFIFAGSMQGQYSGPLIVHAKGKQSVTLTCVEFNLLAKPNVR